MPAETERAAEAERPPELRGERVVLAPVTEGHVPELRRILLTPPVRRRWGDEAASRAWPFDDPSAVRFAVLLEGRVHGMVQYGEEDEPAYRHASIDIFLDPRVHGLGVGRDAVRTLARSCRVTDATDASGGDEPGQRRHRDHEDRRAGRVAADLEDVGRQADTQPIPRRDELVGAQDCQNLVDGEAQDATGRVQHEDVAEVTGLRVRAQVDDGHRVAAQDEQPSHRRPRTVEGVDAGRAHDLTHLDEPPGQLATAHHEGHIATHASPRATRSLSSPASRADWPARRVQRSTSSAASRPAISAAERSGGIATIARDAAR